MINGKNSALEFEYIYFKQDGILCEYLPELVNKG